MANRIEDYALIGNQETVALVGRDGSIDWMGMPRFDSPACFSALLGNAEHGRWLIAPSATVTSITRKYLGDTLILQTQFETAGGVAIVIDFMTRHDGASNLIRIVRGIRGSVEMHTELIVRFDYGSVKPWVEMQKDGTHHFTAGPDRLVLNTAVSLRGEDFRTLGEFTIAAGDEITFTLSWSPSFRECPSTPDAKKSLGETEKLWSEWALPLKSFSTLTEEVKRSLITLKALAHCETGGIIAAATTSLPEKIGGARNWDYRYCWLRDATFTLYALLSTGFVDEARAWREWLVRAVAGSSEDLQIMYGVAGERRLDEYEIPWLPGYLNSSPVRIGNAAASQVQLDVYGEVVDTLYVARKAGLAANDASWALECALIAHLETIWDQPDEGIWEIRGARRHFTHSKVMAWVAFDRAVRSAKEYGLDGPVAHWSAVRDKIHAQVCEHGYDKAQQTFVQSYGDSALDASLLLLAVVGFLPPEDERIKSTIAAIEGRLLRNGLVMRYDTNTAIDGLAPGEGAFLACSFWLVDNYVLQGRIDDANVLFKQLLSYRNDVGLLAEEYDPLAKRQLGNFPQAFSHLALINTAHSLARNDGPAQQRASGSEGTTTQKK